MRMSYLLPMVILMGCGGNPEGVTETPEMAEGSTTMEASVSTNTVDASPAVETAEGSVAPSTISEVPEASVPHQDASTHEDASMKDGCPNMGDGHGHHH